MANKCTDPLKGDQIALVRAIVQPSARDYAIFVLGTNTAFRASDILSLNCGDVKGLVAGSKLTLLEQKTRDTNKKRTVVVNDPTAAALVRLLAELQPTEDHEPLFRNHKRGTRLTVGTLSRLVNKWCKEAGLKGEFSSHSLRKTFGYTMRVQHNVDLSLLQDMYGHSTQKMTLKYVGIQAEEVAAIYMKGVW